ncbi:hypothetical protein PSPO01_00295 [Paraphaeosphaeria sporulosa]
MLPDAAEVCICASATALACVRRAAGRQWALAVPCVAQAGNNRRVRTWRNAQVSRCSSAWAELGTWIARASGRPYRYAVAVRGSRREHARRRVLASGPRRARITFASHAGCGESADHVAALSCTTSPCSARQHTACSWAAATWPDLPVPARIHAHAPRIAATSFARTRPPTTAARHQTPS